MFSIKYGLHMSCESMEPKVMNLQFLIKFSLSRTIPIWASVGTQCLMDSGICFALPALSIVLSNALRSLIGEVFRCSIDFHS